MPSPVCQKSVLGFSQQWQTINVRAVNARALARALVSLRANPCIACLSARFSILCCENPFTQRHTGERTVTQINESNRTELQSATTERKSRAGRRARKAATAAGDMGATVLN